MYIIEFFTIYQIKEWILYNWSPRHYILSVRLEQEIRISIKLMDAPQIERGVKK
jgi:hypothetical protein